MHVNLGNHDLLLVLGPGDQRADFNGVLLRGVELLAELGAQCREPQLDVLLELDVLLLSFRVAISLIVDELFGRCAHVAMSLLHRLLLHNQVGQ